MICGDLDSGLGPEDFSLDLNLERWIHAAKP